MKYIRTTIMVEDQVNLTVRNIQAHQIKQTHGNVSFSSVVNDLLKYAIKIQYPRGLK